jgi:hypothetical protein
MSDEAAAKKRRATVAVFVERGTRRPYFPMNQEPGQIRPAQTAGSVPDAWPQVLSRAVLRVSRSLHTRRPSTWGKNGRLAAKMGRRRLCIPSAAPKTNGGRCSRVCPKGPFDFAHQFREAQLTGPRPGKEHQVAKGRPLERIAVENGLDTTTQPVSHHGAPNCGIDRKADAGPIASIGNQARQKRSGPPASSPVHARKLISARQRTVGPQTVRRLRPFLRRAASTRRPFFVDMRSMKPWTRLRRRLCGWKVRFTGRVLQTTEKVPDPRQQSTISRPCPQRQGRPPECEMFLRFPHVWKTLWTTGAGGGPQTPVPCRFLPVSQ